MMFAFVVSPVYQLFAVAAKAPAPVAQCAKPTFLGLVPWYQYLTVTPDKLSNCAITNFNDSTKVLGSHSPFLLISLAVLDDLVRVAAIVAIGYVIYGGIQYVTSQGAPDATSKARQTIINALIGLGISIMAAGLVSFIGTKLGNVA